jgi:hypothetical protein
VAEVEERWGRLDGVIHSTGVRRPALVPLLGGADLAASLLPKAGRTWVLDQVTAHREPDLFLVSGSLASRQPLVGPGAYAAANAFQAAFAHARAQRRGQRTLVLNWGPWGVGMLNEQTNVPYNPCGRQCASGANPTLP